jgi:SAM-dependent methyltransferase
MDHVRASYDAVAERYAREIGDELAAKPVDRALYALFAELTGTGIVGDVGCGPGHVTAYLAAQLVGAATGQRLSAAQPVEAATGQRLSAAQPVEAATGQRSSAGLGLRPVGVDPSPRMIEVARKRYPGLEFAIGSFTELPVADGGWAGAVAPYSIIHVPPPDRPAAWAELARAIRTGGWLLVAFHIEETGHPAGSTQHITEWWGHPVDLDFHYLEPGQVAAELAAAGFRVMARTDREPWQDVEHQTRRSYLLARRE